MPNPHNPHSRKSDYLTPAQQAELAALAALPDEQIDTADIPEQKDWHGAVRGVFYRPVKSQSDSETSANPRIFTSRTNISLFLIPGLVPGY